MIEIGKLNLLKVSRQSPHGFYLVSGEMEVLLPNKYVPEGLAPGDEIEVFVYKDSEDRPVATTLTPMGMVGDFVCLTVRDVSPIGAFMNWGLEKDLLVPLSEQHRKMKLGEKHVVKIATDPKTERIIGIAKIGGFFSHDLSKIDEGDKVTALIYEITDLGYMAIINNTYKGMIYKNEVFKPIEIGETMPAYIKYIREDGKIDLALYGDKKTQIGDSKDLVWSKLEEKGVVKLSDKSSPEEISKVLGISKRNFKMAIGGLYKEGKIKIEKDRIVKI